MVERHALPSGGRAGLSTSRELAADDRTLPAAGGEPAADDRTRAAAHRAGMPQNRALNKTKSSRVPSTMVTTRVCP